MVWLRKSVPIKTGPSGAGRISLPIGGGARGPGEPRALSKSWRPLSGQGQVNPARLPRPVLCRSTAGSWVHPQATPSGAYAAEAGRQSQTLLTGSGTKSFQCTDLCVLGGFRTPTHFEIKNSVGHAKTPSVGTYRMRVETGASHLLGVGQTRGCAQWLLP